MQRRPGHIYSACRQYQRPTIGCSVGTGSCTQKCSLRIMQPIYGFTRPIPIYRLVYNFHLYIFLLLIFFFFNFHCRHIFAFSSFFQDISHFSHTLFLFVFFNRKNMASAIISQFPLYAPQFLSFSLNINHFIYCEFLWCKLGFLKVSTSVLSDCPARFKGGQKWYQSIGLPLSYQRFALDLNFIWPPS